MKIGFIGLGNMGAPMARNLAAAGHEVTGYDHIGAIKGVKCAVSLEEAIIRAECVILMLPNGAIVREVTREIAPLMPSGTLVVDCSTIDVATARHVAKALAEHMIAFVDAPVSGGTTGAEAGTLTFMAGGDAANFSRAKPLFDIMGARAVHCGAAGAGQAAKICNNMILGATMAATCEAFALAEKLGLGRQEMFDVVSTSSGSSWSMNTYCPAPGIGPESPADRDYAPGFSAALMLKDLRLAQEAAQTCGAYTPIGKAATALYQTFAEEEGHGAKDFSALLPYFAGDDL